MSYRANREKTPTKQVPRTVSNNWRRSASTRRDFVLLQYTVSQKHCASIIF